MCLLDFVENSVTPHRKEERRLLARAAATDRTHGCSPRRWRPSQPWVPREPSGRLLLAGKIVDAAAVSLSVSRLRIADRLADFLESKVRSPTWKGWTTLPPLSGPRTGRQWSANRSASASGVWSARSIDGSYHPELNGMPMGLARPLSCWARRQRGEGTRRLLVTEEWGQGNTHVKLIPLSRFLVRNLRASISASPIAFVLLSFVVDCPLSFG